MSELPSASLQANLASMKQDLEGGHAQLLMTPKEIDRLLNQLEDAFGDAPTAILQRFSQARSLVAAIHQLSPNATVKLLGLLSNGFRKMVNFVEICLQSNDLSDAINMKFSCESYGYLLLGAATFVETCQDRDRDKSKRTTAAATSKLEWDHVKLQMAESAHSLLSLPISRLFESKVDAEGLVVCLVKLLHLFLERPETLKVNGLRRAILETLAAAAAQQNYSEALKTILVQDLTCFDHLSEFVADLLSHLALRYENGTAMTIVEDVLRQVGTRQMVGYNESTSAKIIAEFLEHLSVANPKLSLRHLSYIIGSHFDSGDSHTIRMALVQVVGNIVKYLNSSEGRLDDQSLAAQTKSLFSVLEERFYDINSFVRARLLNVLAELCRQHCIPVNRRSRILQLTIERAMDKSSTVRKKAVQLLVEIMRAHPFGLDGGELDLEFFENRLASIDGLLGEVSEDVLAESDAFEVTHAAPSNQLNALLMQKRYYSDAVKFVQQLDKVVPVLAHLLSSTIKTEVFEVMDFFVEAQLYRLRSAGSGVRKMMHLVWEKDLEEEGAKRSVRDHLVECYRRIYLTADDRLSGKEKVLSVVDGLLQMVAPLNLAELTSLDELIQLFVKRGLIGEPIIQALFNVIVDRSTSSRPQAQRSAIIVFAMVGKADRSVVEKRMDGLVRVGLGPLGHSDPVVAQYTCQAIQSIAFVQTESEIYRLQTMTEVINAIYLLADRPDVLCAEMVHFIVKQIFPTTEEGFLRNSCSSWMLAKLLFLAGQIVIQHNLHLDSIERRWKQRTAARRQPKDVGLDRTTSSADDDIAEAIRQAKENELLYGDQSLMATFGSLAVHNETLQRVATLTLGKFMSVSARYCQENLPLLLACLERSPDPIIRSNLAIAFGDIAQSFSQIADPHIHHLFALLCDSDPLVRRNAMMVLTHLTLSGMIKVRGQQIGVIAQCIEDDDLQIRDLARLFFSELAGKDSSASAVYNYLPDIITSLSANGDGHHDDRMSRILRFIFAFIKKERQLEALIEKLCIRMRQLDDIKVLQSTAHCISLLPIYGNANSGDRVVNKLIDNIGYYRDKLTDPVIAQSFGDILSRLKRPGIKDERLDIWEEQLKGAMLHEDAYIKRSTHEDGELPENKANYSRSRRSAASRHRSANIDSD